MSEITKLYENAGVKKEVIPCPAKYYGYDCTRNNWDDEDCSCDIEGYPPFTAEKQIELIKWCLDNYRGYIFDSIETEWFEEQLCAFINNIWQDLTEAEKQQVKGILECAGMQKVI